MPFDDELDESEEDMDAPMGTSGEDDMEDDEEDDLEGFQVDEDDEPTSSEAY